MPYTMQASAPAAPAKAPDPSPNIAGVAIFPETTSKDPGTSSPTEAPAPSDSSASSSSSASRYAGTSPTS